MNKLFAFLLVAVLAFPAVFAADLSDYPTYFDDVSIVIEEGSGELGKAFDLANAFTNAGITNQIRMDSEFSDVTGLQIISIGSNTVTTTLTENDDAIYTTQSGEAVIKLYENGNAVQIVILGDTAKGAHVLANWEDFPIKFTQTVVQGMIPDLTLHEVIEHEDYTCDGTQYFGLDGSWPEPCIIFDLELYFDPNAAPVDDGTGDDGSGDSGTGDSGTGDSGTGDSGTGDSGTGDSGTGDSGTGDSGTGDSGTGDSGTGDSGTGDSGTGDSGTGDSGTGDSGTNDPVVTPGASFAITNFVLGGSNQNRGETVSTTTTITNTGTVDLTGFTASGINSKYNLSISDFPATLASGQTATVTVNAYVALDLNAVDNSCDDEAQNIGTLTIDTTQNAKSTTDPKMQAINELRITDVDAIVEDDRERFEDRTVEAFWDDNVEIIVEVMNRFNDNNDEGQDAEIEVEVEIEGDTDEIDLDDKREDVDVDADEKEELSFSGRIEDDARGKIKLEITAEGRDENGALHCDFTIGKFDVFEGYRPTVFNSDLIDNRDETINFTPFPENDEQTTPTATQPQDEPREETVEPVVQTAPVSRDKFRDGNGYAWLLVGMILLMLAVLAAEVAYIMHKRKQLKEQEFYGETYETVEQ